MIYGNKHVVFEQVGVDSNSYFYNNGGGADSDGAYNDYEISTIRNTVLLQNIISYLSNELTNELVSTTVQTAKNGNSSTLISTDDKLFLPASKEVGRTGNSVNAENNALTTWTYWTTHTTDNDHIKYNNSSTAKAWWNRSPKSGSSGEACVVWSSGSIAASSTSGFISSCFAW